MGRIKKVCLLRFGGMGDILLATPTLRAIDQTFHPEAIDLIVGKGMREAVVGISYVRQVTEWNKKGPDAHLGNFLRFLIALRQERYDLFLNFQPGTRANLMALASGAKHIITFIKDRRKQPDTGRVRHAIDDFTKEIAPLGITTVTDRRMDFYIPDTARESLQAKLKAESVSSPYIVINPAGTREINRWPPEKFAGLLRELSAHCAEQTPVLVGGPGDHPFSDAVRQSFGPVIDLTGKLSVKELGALLEGASCVVTGDTGPLHIASAVGAPIVCLSGAADPDRTGPTMPLDLVVIRHDLSCVPCQDRRCRRGDIACMTGLPVEWVRDAVLRRMNTR